MAVWVIVNVEEWDINADDAAHGADAAGRRLADARHPELGLARIRQPRRLLAHAGGVRRLQGPGVLAINGSAIAAYRADRRARRSSATGSSWATASPRSNMQKVENEREDIRKTTDGHRQGFTGKRAARLARPRPHRDLGDAGPPRGGRLRLCRRLGAGRPAGRG